MLKTNGRTVDHWPGPWADAEPTLSELLSDLMPPIKHVSQILRTFLNAVDFHFPSDSASIQLVYQCNNLRDELRIPVVVRRFVEERLSSRYGFA